MGNKKYYWLQLKTNFFANKAMKKLRRIAGGDTYTIIYLKLMLLSLKDEGILYYDGVEPTFYEEMALALDEDEENVKVTLVFLESVGLLEHRSENEYFLTEVPYLIGGECESAGRVRKHRAQKALQCNADVTDSNTVVTNGNTEIDIDKDKEINIEGDIEKRESKKDATASTHPHKEPKQSFGEYLNVEMTKTEIDKLIEEYGEEMTQEAVKFLDEYIEMKGYKARSHYLCVRKWVIDAVKEKQAKEKPQNSIGYDDLAAWANTPEREVW